MITSRMVVHVGRHVVDLALQGQPGVLITHAQLFRLIMRKESQREVERDRD